MPHSPFHLLPLLAAGLIVTVFALPARAQMDVDPSDLYLKAYLVMRDAQKLEEDAKFDYSYEKYLEATELFDAVARSYPSWNPHMVNFRRKKIRQAITELKANGLRETGSLIGPGGPGSTPSGERTMPATAPASPPIAPIGGPGALPPPPQDPNDPLPLPRQAPVTLVPSRSATPNVVAKIPVESGTRSFSPRGSSSINAATSHIEVKFEELHTRIAQLDTEKQNLVYRLEARETDLVTTREELTEAKKSREELEEKLAKSQSRLHVNAATGSTEIEELRTEVALLTAQLKIAKASLNLAGRKTSDLIADLESSQKEIVLLKEERSQLIDERHQMTALLGNIGKDSPHNVSHLMAINANLRRQLDTARAAAEQLASERAGDREQIAALKAEIASVTNELQGVRSENESYRVQVAKLTEKLESVSRDLADSGSSAVNAEALEENQMLRDIILRQLRQQARRQQAKELVMQELAKLEINSKNLFDHIEDLAGSRVILTDKERSLFRDSYVAPLLADSDMHGTLLSVGDSGEEGADAKKTPVRVPSSDSKAEIARLATDASKRFDEEKFDEAESLYHDILKLDRQNIYSLCNLGTIKLRLGKHSESEVLFNKAIAYEPKYARAHFMLGVTYFHEQKLDEALEAISQAVQLDENNAWAHQYLGLIASHKGWIKRAEDEFKKAIAIYPAFAEAHFNLSILYIKSEDSSRDLAEEHYNKALDYGAEPDPVMEDYLKG